MKKFYKSFGKRSRCPFRKPTINPLNREVVERDHMPTEVATALLLEPKARLTNTMRKACWDARSTVFQSTLEPKSHADHLERRAKAATWAQLCKWKPRIEKRLRGVEYAERKIKGMDDKAQQLRQILIIREQLLTTALDVVSIVMDARMAKATANTL